MNVEFNLRSLVRPIIDAYLPLNTGKSQGLKISVNLKATVRLDYHSLTQEARDRCDIAQAHSPAYEAFLSQSVPVRIDYLFVRPSTPQNQTLVLQQVGIGADEAEANLLFENGEFTVIGRHEVAWFTAFEQMDAIMTEQGNLLRKEMGYRVAPEFREEIRVHYETDIESVQVREIEMERRSDKLYHISFKSRK